MLTTDQTKKNIIRFEDDRYYISADSTYADDRMQVLNHCDSFGIFNRWGDILPFGKEIQGLYFQDTRFINQLELKINGIRPTLLSSAIKEENEIHSVDLTNPELKQDSGELLHHGNIHIRRSQSLKGKQFYEDIQLENYNNKRHAITLSINFCGDFKDIFEIRGLERPKRGKLLPSETNEMRHLTLSYRGLDHLLRKAEIRFSRAFEGFRTENNLVEFHLILDPKKKINIEYHILFAVGQDTIHDNGFPSTTQQAVPDRGESKSYFPEIATTNEQFSHWVHRSKTDLISLMADTDFGKYPYAGVPWYNTAFGRDGIITALETLWLAPKLSKDVLLYLAANQADKYDESADAEPGKILHETRGGEMVNLNEVPFRQYYGTIDATPLFIILAGEYYERTGDRKTIRKIWPNILAATEWINKYGDIDGDGLVEYQHKAENGLTNQGWKDSHDSVFYEDGTLATPPIALCEVQAYVYAAKIHAAHLALEFGEDSLSVQWKKEARQLKEKFNDLFWDKKLNTYVLALDGNKRPCRVKSSNAGQILFTGIADREKAGKLVKTLMAPDLFSDWGIRTLSTNEIRYNPMSYHNGSIWPHDVALIADGMSRYGFNQEALRLMTGLFDASLFINLQRLPELFCGIDRRKGEGPTAYPVACSPQAWSVAAVFLLLKAILQIKISPLKREISFRRPILPPYLESIEIKGIEISENTFVDLEIMRHGSDNMVGINWKNQPEDWKLIIVK